MNIIIKSNFVLINLKDFSDITRENVENFLKSQFNTLIVGLQEIEETFRSDVGDLFTQHQLYFEKQDTG